jgi:GntR family transcriptional regulator, transcriptional repressor for pyruvate dehydrogenase complex
MRWWPVTPQSAIAQQAVLSPMQVPKASDVLANDLRERILSGEFPEGTSLPPEREMVAQTQMSRTTVREALRILEVQGLVRIRTGRSGGAFVQRPDGDSVAHSVSLLIRGRQIRMAALLEAREGVEPVCARLAAKYRTEEDLERLEAANAAVAAEGPLEDFLQANVDWHVAVATASHNELLTGFMSALSRALYASTDNSSFVDAEVRAIAVQAHARINEAIRDRDAEAALRRMTRHVHSYAEAIAEVDRRTAIEVPES